MGDELAAGAASMGMTAKKESDLQDNRLNLAPHLHTRPSVYTCYLSIFQELVIQGLGDSYHQPLIAKLQFGTAAYKQDLGIEVSERQMYDLAFESNLIKLLLQETLK